MFLFKRIFLFTIIASFFLSCSTQKLTIRVCEKQGTYDTIRCTYTLDTISIPMRVPVKKTSKIENVSYMENLKGEIECAIILSDGHILHTNVMNDILKHDNIIGREYSYEVDSCTTSIDMPGGYVKLTEWIKDGKVDSVFVENIVSVIQTNHVLRETTQSKKVTTETKYDECTLLEVSYKDTSFFEKITDDWFENQIQNFGRATVYMIQKPIIEYFVLNVKCVDKKKIVTYFGDNTYKLKLLCTDDDMTYWVETDRATFYHTDISEKDNITYECARHLHETKKTSIEIVKFPSTSR